MTIFLLPDECISIILSFLDDHSLYNCLFINRYLCRFTVPLLWREPFSTDWSLKTSSIIETLLSCINENEISSLIPCKIKLVNQIPLFEYGKFIRKIDHEACVRNVVIWLNCKMTKDIDDIVLAVFDFEKYQECRVRRLVNVIYQIIMRQVSNLLEFVITNMVGLYLDLPKSLIFTINNPGIMHLTSLSVTVNLTYHLQYINTIEFLNKLSKYCNGIVNCKLLIYGSNGFNNDNAFIEPLVDLIMLQPLESISIRFDGEENIKNIMDALSFRAKTLKDLLILDVDFRHIGLSFLNKLECLENLNFDVYRGFTHEQFEILSKKNFSLKELKLWHYSEIFYNDDDFVGFDNQLYVMKAMINSLCDEKLLKLSLNIVTPEIVLTIKETCPKINFLYIEILSEQFFIKSIQVICELSFLKTLKIEVFCELSEEVIVLSLKTVSNHLKSLENLSLKFL